MPVLFTMVNSGTFTPTSNHNGDESAQEESNKNTTSSDNDPLPCHLLDILGTAATVPNKMDDAEKARFVCSLPLDKVQTVLYNNTIDHQTTQQKLVKSSVQRKVLCLFCDRTFVSDTLRQKHVERCHSPKQFRRVSLRKQQNHFTSTPCVYCDKLSSSNHTLSELFAHLIHNHSNKYFGCLTCEDRFLNKQQLEDHRISIHNQRQETGEDGKKRKLATKNGKKTKNAKVIVKRSKRLQAKIVNEPELKSKTVKKAKNVEKPTDNLEPTSEFPTQTNEKPAKVSNSVNPYPEFDNFFQVKKITDHSIDNLKISSLTFDDVFDKAFFNRIRCNIQDNLLNHIDGKLFKNEESENRISNFEKICSVQHSDSTNHNLSQENYGCELSLNAVTPTTSSLLSTQQFGEDPESQIEYGSKPSKKKAPAVKKDQVHYKYFTRRKYQAIILEQKENRDLSKLDMWTQLLIKNRQQKIADDQKTPKEILDYFSGDEYKNKMRRDELNRILDRRGPFEDLREEVSKRAALDNLKSSDDIDVKEEVRELLNDLINNVFEMMAEEEEAKPLQQIPITEIPSYLNLRRTTSVLLEEDSQIDKSDKIALICSSQETENFELPTNTVRRKNEKVELSGEWARSRIYICAACGLKLLNMKQFLEHKSNAHQYVWVQHYEFVGNQSELYRHLSIPVLGKVGVLEENTMSKIWKRSEARLCTKCAKVCNSLGELHRHILECGGDWTWMLARKKCKYRPFGAKSRRKRRGLVKRICTQKTQENGEKKIYKKRVDGPRQKPSDAETIQRMLANLPPKRATRKLISLKDGFNAARNSVQKAAKLKCGKIVHTEKKTSSNLPLLNEKVVVSASSQSQKQQNKINYRRSLRTLNKVMATRILDTNSTLVVRRKYKTKLNKEKQQQQQNSGVDKKMAANKAKTVTAQRRMRNNEEDSSIIIKRTSPRIGKKLNDLMPVQNAMNIKRFFPVQKKKKIDQNNKTFKRKLNDDDKTEAVIVTKKPKQEIKTLRKRKSDPVLVVEEPKVVEDVKNKESRTEKIKNKFRNVVNRIKEMKAKEKTKKDCQIKEVEIEEVKEEKLKENVDFLLEKNIAEEEEKPPVLQPEVCLSASEKEEKSCPENIEKVENETNNLLVAVPAPKIENKKVRRRPTRGLNACIAMLTNKLTCNKNIVQEETILEVKKNDAENDDKEFILKVPLSNEHFCLKQKPPPLAPANEDIKQITVVDPVIISDEKSDNCVASIEDDLKVNVPVNGESKLKCSNKNSKATSVRKKKKKKKISEKAVGNLLLQSNIGDYFDKTPIPTSQNEVKEDVVNDNTTPPILEIKPIESDDEVPLAVFLKEDTNTPIIPDKTVDIPDNNVQNNKIDNEEVKHNEEETINKEFDSVPLNASGGSIDELVPSPKSADKCSNLEYFDKLSMANGELDIPKDTTTESPPPIDDNTSTTTFNIFDFHEDVDTTILKCDDETKTASTSTHKENVDSNLLVSNDRRKIIRCAKAKAIENIHDEALAELTESERNREPNLPNDTLLVENDFNKSPITEKRNRTIRKSITNKKTNNNSPKSNVKDVVETVAAKKEETETKELRRSGRNSKKIIYNEIDLVDPLIDELDSKMEKEIKNIQIPELINLKSDYHPKNNTSTCSTNTTTQPLVDTKLNSDELFDLLKATPDENVVLSKPTNNSSFLNNFDDLSDDGINTVFDNILDKSDIEDVELINKPFDSLIITSHQTTFDNNQVVNGVKPSTTTTVKKIKRKKKIVKRKQHQQQTTKVDKEIPSNPITNDNKQNVIDEETDSLDVVNNKNYCEICNKSFCRLEGLIKHKRTLTHISKLSELEAKEAALKVVTTPTINEDTFEEESIIENNSDKIESHTESEPVLAHHPFSLTVVDNNSCLKLADIINDVLNKPSMEENCEMTRCRSLGERKSFEKDTTPHTQQIVEIPKTTPPLYFEQQITANTAQTQITLLENIIENRLDLDMEENNDLDENSLSFPMQKSINKNFLDEQNARKVLNRDEELFLECCSLLKSGSEVSNFPNKSKQINDGTKQLLLRQQSIDCLDSNSGIVMGFDENEGSSSNCWNNNLLTDNHLKSNAGFTFDNSFKDNSMPHIQRDVFDDSSNNSNSSMHLTITNKNNDDLSDGSTTTTTTTDSKKMLTKGAMKVFEGLKVSIPTEELNLDELLSPKIKTTLNNPNKCHQQLDVYDFEETQDNCDIFDKRDFKTFRNTNIDTKKVESDDDSCLDALSSSSSDAKLLNTPNKTQENITKKKCMIMGRIFKNAAKSKIDDDIRNIPIVDNNKLVEDFVLNCPPIPPTDDENVVTPDSPPPIKVMTEEEMNLAFDKLIGNIKSTTTSTNHKKSNSNTNIKKPTKSTNKITAKKRNLDESDVSDDEFALKKSPKKRTKRKNTKAEDNCINLEQELRECIGVAGRKSQRKCTSGKQNVLIEYWSSDESSFETIVENEKPIMIEPKHVVEEKKEDVEIVVNVIEQQEKKKIENTNSSSTSSSCNKTKISSSSSSSSSSPRKKRVAANPLYHWSSSSEDEAGDLIEVKPIRDEIDDDEDRPIQHGWIVGDSPKKLVKMLAQAKGKKCDTDGVKEQGKKRTNTFS